MSNSKNDTVIPNRIAELRAGSGMTQQDLSDRLFIDRRTVSRIERGKFLTLDTLIHIADVFGVTLDYIMYRSDNKKEPITVDKFEVAILEELKSLTEAEKERLLKHIVLDNTLKMTAK